MKCGHEKIKKRDFKIDFKSVPVKGKQQSVHYFQIRWVLEKCSIRSATPNLSPICGTSQGLYSLIQVSSGDLGLK